MSARWLLAAPLAMALVACSGAQSGTGGSSGGSIGGSSGSAITFWGDVAPIVEQHCITCHQPGGIAPFSLEDYADAKQNANLMAIVVQPDQAPQYGYDVMPPWPPGPDCNTYANPRTLSDSEIQTIVQWAQTGAQEGGPPLTLAPPDAGPALAHVDATLAMPQAYLPTLSPDDYHCFVLDWPEQTTKYVTGLTVTPGNPKIVHHVIAYVAGPADASKYEALANSDGGVPGYTCFGGAGADDSAQWLGAWAPGATQGEFPAGTGIEVQPGSKVIIQVHYNVLNGPGESDLTQVNLELADSVQTRAAILPFLDLQWYFGNMPIAAGDPDAGVQYAVDPTPFMDRPELTNGAVPANSPFRIWSAGAHMHLRGKREHLGIERADGGNTCLLDVPHWDFHWQGAFPLAQPETFNPGDQLEIDCHWDNSAANQPRYPDGGQEVPRNLNWGEGTDDEMCLGVFYVSP